LEQLLERLRAVPGVQAAAVGSNVPFGGDDGFRPIHPLDGATTAAGLRADLRVISEDYLRVLGIPVSGGRMFSAADGAAPVGAAIVNQTFARKLGGDVIGRRLRIESGQAPLSGYEIVGVVGDARSSGDTTGIWDEIYIPLAQANPSILFIVVESTLDARTLDGAIRRELRSALPERVDDPIVTLTSMEALVGASLARPRFSATLIGAFSANALLLAAIGVFSLITYSVAQRQPEFGLRAALGADSRRLLFMVLNSTAALVGVGMGTGLVGALYATRLVASQLYGVDPLDVPTFVGSTMLMTLGAGVAAYLPARRASRVDPMVALRGE
jgi:putative ABC transport system permease protein